VRGLSPAARQLVEIARALAFEARLLIMDEPTSSLGRDDAARLFALVRELARKGVAVVYVSHFLDEVRQVADRYTVLRDGATAGTGAVADATIDRWIELMAGRRVEDLYPRGPRRPAEVLLEVRALAGFVLPRSASFELRRGEVFGVAGLVGAGRTELFRALYGLDPVVRGEVKIRGLAVAEGANAVGRRVAQGLGLLSEDRKGEGLALDLGLADNVTLSRLEPYVRGGFVSLRRRAAAAATVFALLGVKARGTDQRARALSGGNQQKVAFARLLHQEADVVLLDEPTRGVDVRSKAEIYRLIDRLAQEGRAVLIASSYPPELLGVCDRVAVIRRGVLSSARPAAAWTEGALAAACAVGESGEGHG
jgi:ribose transport system ATP-binding protein